MLGHTACSGRHIVRRGATGITGTGGQSAEVWAHNAQRIVNGKRERYRTPLAAVVQYELCLGGTAPLQGCCQLEPPMVFIAAQNLPATFLIVPDAPSPVAAAKLGWYATGRFVKQNDG